MVTGMVKESPWFILGRAGTLFRAFQQRMVVWPTLAPKPQPAFRTSLDTLVSASNGTVEG